MPIPLWPYISRYLSVCLAYFVIGNLFSASNLIGGESDDVYFQRIKPLIAEKCQACHGSNRAEAGLRLDAIQFIRAGGDDGSIVDWDNASNSRLLARLTTRDPELRMPPEDAGAPVTPEQLAIITQWVEGKLPGPDEETFVDGPQDHWAFQPPVKLSLPVSDVRSPLNPIDHFIRKAQQAKGTRPLERATDAVWLRRATFDLSGLPPTIEALTEFRQNSSFDKREEAVERLLASPTYGEHWGRHWMDIWRYSDWDGYKADLRSSQKHIWHWRDWIVESLNENKPYDVMIQQMLAADEIDPLNQKELRATGFLARNFHKSNRNIWLDATVEHTAKAFFGMTMNCAKCHDHKYDPIRQANYYQFRAIFEPHRIRTQQLPGVYDLEKDGIPCAFDDDVQVATYIYQRGNEKHPLKESPVEPSLPEFIDLPFDIQPVELPLESYYPELSSVVRKNTLDAKQQAESVALSKLQSVTEKLRKAEEANSFINDRKSYESLMDEIELASSELKLAMADRVSTDTRYAAELAKYSTTLMGPSKPPAPKEATNADLKDLAEKAALAEHRFKIAKAAHELLVKRRAISTAMNSKEPDVKKKEASLAAAREAFTKSQKDFDLLNIPLAPGSIDYSPLGKPTSSRSSGRRLALARWITHPKNPLTARVAINHIWTWHFGTPLVENTFDFGMSTAKPELIELLDWLAADFQQSGWDMKHIHRLILTSETYAMASDSPHRELYEKNLTLDRENHSYWRANIRRLEAEQVRDSLIAVGNALDQTMYGLDIDFASAEDVMRRSLYFRHAYEKQVPMLVLFDAASPSECYRRKPSIIPQQALAMANSLLARRMGQALAKKSYETALTEATSEKTRSAHFIEQVFQRALGRTPTQAELQTCQNFLATQTTDEEQARESLAVVLLNHHDFVSLR